MFFFLIPIFGTFMVNSYLSFAATSEFKITFLGAGPTELRLALIALNTAIILLGASLVQKILPFAVPLTGILLIVVVFRTQKYIWRIDMEDKRRRS